MNLSDIIFGSGGAVALLLTMVEVSSIKINPWSAIAKALGRAFNGDVLKKLESMQATQAETRKKLEAHIRQDADRAADLHRARILRFNNEILQSKPHTREEFIDILAEIDAYRSHCRQYEDYPNSRATHAMANIERVYDDRLRKQDFL